MTAAAITQGALRSDAEAILAARRFAGSIAPGVVDRDRAGALPVVELAELGASGLLAITVPRAYGGTDVSMVTLAEVIRTIAAVDPAIAQVPQGHFLMVDVLAVFVYCGIVTFIILAILKYTIGISVSEDVEVEGLDINLHGEVVQG